jgi:hypothetical protein
LTRFNFDAPLIAAFMDRWRPETHTFHFPVGEMTLSLEDAAMLGGLWCAGETMGPIDIPATWQVLCSVRERYSERSHAGAVSALRRNPRAHLDLDPAVQRT